METKLNFSPSDSIILKLNKVRRSQTGEVNEQVEGLKFRIAVDADAQDINNLVNSVYRGENSKMGWTTEADLLGGQRIDPMRAREIIHEKDSAILLALIEDKIKACVHLKKRGDACHLGMLSVDVHIQGQGLGKELIEKSEMYARQTFGCKKMEMEVIGQRPELIEYYTRRGYVVSGEKRPFPMNDPRFGIPKRQDLYFEILIKPL